MNAKKLESVAAAEIVKSPTTGAETPAAYQKPTILELGSLDRLQAYGFNYFDGRRYKNDPCS